MNMQNINLETDKTVVTGLYKRWLTKSAVRNPEYSDDQQSIFDASLHDFPHKLIPFHAHPKYVELEEPIKKKVESYAWIAWNKRVVDTEELVVAPALAGLLNGATDIKLSGVDRGAIRQTIIDEYFHTHMHEVAVGLTCNGRGIPQDIMNDVYRPAYSYRSYRETADQLSEQWEKDIARLAWVVVGELSIYEFLGLVSNDPMIQPASRTLLKLHEKDEAGHQSVIGNVMRDNFNQFGDRQRAHFAKCLPLAMNGFLGEDWLVWQDILTLAGVESAKEIVLDLQNDKGVPDELPMIRSYRTIDSFCNDVGIDTSRWN